MQETGKYRILVIDEDENTRQKVCLALAEAGYRVRDAANCRAGLQILNRAPFDLVITDESLPTAEGNEIIRKFRQLAPWISIILMSANDDTSAQAARKMMGITEIRKPFQVTALLQAVSRLLAGEKPQTSPSSPLERRRHLRHTARLLIGLTLVGIGSQGGSFVESYHTRTEDISRGGIGLTIHHPALLDCSPDRLLKMVLLVPLPDFRVVNISCQGIVRHVATVPDAVATEKLGVEFGELNTVQAHGLHEYLTI